MFKYLILLLNFALVGCGDNNNYEYVEKFNLTDTQYATLAGQKIAFTLKGPFEDNFDDYDLSSYKYQSNGLFYDAIDFEMSAVDSSGQSAKDITVNKKYTGINRTVNNIHQIPKSSREVITSKQNLSPETFSQQLQSISLTVPTEGFYKNVRFFFKRAQIEQLPPPKSDVMIVDVPISMADGSDYQSIAFKFERVTQHAAFQK